jgi:hypothetical protein
VHGAGRQAGRGDDLVAEPAPLRRVEVEGRDLVAAFGEVLGDAQPGQVVGEESDRGDAAL